MKKYFIFTHFKMKITRTCLYITCNKKVLLKYIGLLWVPTDFSILLVAAIVTDDYDDDMMIAQ